MAARLYLRLINETPGLRPPRRLLREVLGDAFGARSREDATLNVLFLPDAAMARLHRQYAHVEGTTDVLSFGDGTANPRTRRLHLGDLAVGAEVAAREAAARHRPAADELVLYALHGLLHLLGHDDLDAEARRAMFKAQAAVLRRHGLAADEEP